MKEALLIILIKEKIMISKKPKIGLLTGAYFEYWKMYPGLDKKVERDMKKLSERLSKRVDVVWSGWRIH